MSKMTAPGWEGIPATAELKNGFIVWYDEADHTFWEVDPVDGTSRHKGDGPGCFWTDPA